MSRFVAILWFCFISIVPALSQANGAETLVTGQITGAVVDETGQRVAGARIEFMRASSAHNSILKFVESDSTGTFTIANLPVGTYWLFGKKETSFYPDNTFAFYGYGNDHSTSSTVVELTALRPRTDVTITVLRGAALKGTIVDQTSGKPIGNARFILRRSDNPKLWLSTNTPSDYRVLAPARVAFTLEVSAPEYRTAQYPKDGKSFVLQPGTEVVLRIGLTPEDKSSASVRNSHPQ